MTRSVLTKGHGKMPSSLLSQSDSRHINKANYPNTNTSMYCDYACDLERCTGLFAGIKRQSPISLKILRPCLGQGRGGLSNHSTFSYFGSEFFLAEGDRTRQLCTATRIVPGARNLFEGPPVLAGIQAYILSHHGRTCRVSELSGLSDVPIAVLSRKFKLQAGVGLKAFIDRIRLCYCLWDLVCTDNSVKRIALEHGYKPVSFSLRFHGAFKVCPSQARTAREALHGDSLAPGTWDAYQKRISFCKKR